MNKIASILLAAILLLPLSACHEIEEQPNDARGNFETLWKLIDEKYCFLEEKGLDWDEVHERYSAKIFPGMTRQQLFTLMSDMLDELRDGHVNLSSPFATSYYKKWWSDYPQNFDERIIQQYYFNFNYRQLGAFTYQFLPQNIGYIRYSTFEGGFGAGNFDYILQYFQSANALIIDVRDNGGGDLENVEQLVNRFIEQKTLVGYFVHKNGPGHGDFDKPYAYYFYPAGEGHLGWTKPVVVLCNRSTFSAANNFVSIMRLLPNCTVVGSVTGGGSGMPLNQELPNGWSVRFSACSILDADGQTTEFGVEPSPGCAVDMTAEDMARGRDTILDFAVEYINSRLL